MCYKFICQTATGRWLFCTLYIESLVPVIHLLLIPCSISFWRNLNTLTPMYPQGPIHTWPWMNEWENKDEEHFLHIYCLGTVGGLTVCLSNHKWWYSKLSILSLPPRACLPPGCFVQAQEKSEIESNFFLTHSYGTFIHSWSWHCSQRCFGYVLMCFIHINDERLKI